MVRVTAALASPSMKIKAPREVALISLKSLSSKSSVEEVTAVPV